MKGDISTCDLCGKTEPSENAGSFWSLNNYHGLSGLFCSSCFTLVQHDPWKNPINVVTYTTALVQYQLIKANGLVNSEIRK